ncbi:uncharacterized protein LOC135831298 [Planococcus citri]|uniref:uncharacterized protein LOC135831298 n=1 Tax=Planococcus citri TaxID=170843 RepID=UPI0031F929DE
MYAYEWRSYTEADYESDYDYNHCDHISSKSEPKTTTVESFFKFHDVSIKVGEKTYLLNRLQLALVSNYFEKLFTEDYAEKNSNFVEIGALDSDTFSVIVDVINGKDIESFINPDSYVSLLIAMDYLQMEIDLKPFETFLWEYINKDIDFDVQMLELCNFIGGNQDYKYLESRVHYYLSCHFEDLLDYQEFLLLRLEDLVDIMKMQQRSTRYYPCAYEKNIVSRICAKWICHDVKKRLNGFVKLVNAANYRLFRTSFRITAANVNISLNNVKEDTIEEEIRKHFFELLDYSGKIDPDDPEDQKLMPSWRGRYTRAKINEIDKKQKWIKFFENEYLYDVTIKAGEKTYKLHQSVLKTASRYFTDLFSAKNCQSLGQSAESSTCESKDIQYTVDFDETTFDAVIRFVYFDDIKMMKTLAESLGMLKAGETLEMNKLIEKSLSWMESNAKDFSVEDILQILDLTVGDDSFSNVSSACKQISNLVCKFFESDAAKNLTRDFYHRIWKVNEILQCVKLTKKCTRWVLENLRTLNNDDIIKIFNKKHAEDEIIEFLDSFSGEKSYFDCVSYMLYASENLGVKKLANACLKWIFKNVEKMTPENVIEVLNFTRGKERFDREHAFLLYKHVIATWPDINESLFCTITCATLKNILALPSFHFDDPHQIVDICAKWIVHDVTSRYQLIREIASNINRNRTVNCDDYKISKIPQDLSSCSQQSIRDKLWEILCLTSLVPHSSMEDSTMGEIPIFIATSDKYRHYRTGFQCNILDVKLNSIAPLRSLQFHYENDSEKYYHPEYPLSATLIEDNLFMLCEIYDKSAFYVYNLSLKQLYSLAGIPRITRGRDGVILNCEGQVYCCFRESGVVMRYSVELNRWEMIFKGVEITRYGFRSRRIYLYTSDGTHLYRVFKNNSDRYVAQMWNFKQNSWILLPDLPTLPHSECPLRLTNVKDGIAILLQSVIFLFDLNLSSWREISLPVRCISSYSTDIIIIAYYDNSLLYVYESKMYSYQLQNLQENWTMIKDELYNHAFCNVAVIHRCFNDTWTRANLPKKQKKIRRRKNQKNQS